MGMIYVLRRATDAQLDRMLAEPSLIEHFLFEEPRESAVVKTGLMEKLVTVFKFNEPVPHFDNDREEGDEIDLDKSWHGLHFVLAGDAGATGAPLSFLIEEWPRFGDVDVGYGPAMAIKAEKVARFANALSDFKPADMQYGYKPEKMLEEDVYLADFFRRE